MVRFELNGSPVEADGVLPTTTLLDWLRQTRRTGTKEGCAEGDCGACSVAILDRGRWRAVDSCLVLVPMVHGRKVLTVEGGIGDPRGPHPVQTAIVDALGSQCGYCTPGFAMTMFEACYRADLDPGREWKLADQLCGNLCRCTGYRPLRDAARRVAGQRPADRFRAAAAEPELPAEAVVHEVPGAWFRAPTTLDEAVDALARNPTARVVCGGTDLVLDVTLRHQRFPALLSVERIAELRGVRLQGDTLSIGAVTPLTDLEDATADALPVLHRMLRYFGSRQIKHRATIGGNLCNASPIGDIAPVLLALDARLVVRGPAGERTIPIDAWFEGYRKTALRPGELLARIEIDRPGPGVKHGAYKVSRRRELDISAVSAAMRVELDGGRVRTIRLAYGGMAATSARARKTEAALVGQAWTAESVRAAAPNLEQDFAPIDDHRGSAGFRRTLARNLLLGFEAETRDHDFVPLPDDPVGTVQAS